MPCNHKFKEYLNLEKLDFEPTTLIVGTFNPAWPDTNYAEWFYGRVSNNYFWDVLPRIYNEPGLRKSNHLDWKLFCRNHLIAITDLISTIDDADIFNERHSELLSTYSDSSIESSFKEFTPTEIIALFQSKPKIKNVYLTTTITKGPFKDLWDKVEVYCNKNKRNCKQLMTPSKGARFSMTKGSGIKMPDFIYMDWKEKWHKM